MRIAWWRKPKRDAEIDQAKERVARTAQIIAEQREQVDEVVRYHTGELQMNHLAERVRRALGDHPR